MSRSTDPTTLPQEILYAAAEWYASLYDQDCTPEIRQYWQQWLMADERHRVAWQQVEAIHQRFNGVDGRLAAPTLKRAGVQRRQVLKLVALVGLTGVGSYLLPWQSYAADYRTAVGERRSFTLDDGSKIWMNTDSALNLTSGGGTTQLRLLQGEIAVVTRTRQTLTLVVSQGEVVLDPSECSLWLTADLCGVAVYQGALWIQPRAQPAQRQSLIAQQQASFTRQGIETLGRVEDFRRSWKAGMLVVDNMPLSQFVTELNRYWRGHLTLESTATKLSISGVFALDRPEQILTTLTEVLPVTLHRRFPGWTEIRTSSS